MPNPKVQASTQQHLDIETIKDNLIFLKNGGAALVLQTTAINFDLLSEKEQDATIYAYAALLNSLTFPLQIFIRSKRTDVSTYLKRLEQAGEKQQNPDLKVQIQKYGQFIKETVKKNRVLDKKFYLVIPFTMGELGIKGGLASISGSKTQFSQEYVTEQAKTALYPKRDHLQKLLGRLGLKAVQLTTHQLIELFYDIYNPGQISAQKITPQAGSYTTVMVEPSVEGGENEAIPQAQDQSPPQQKASLTGTKIPDELKVPGSSQEQVVQKPPTAPIPSSPTQPNFGEQVPPQESASPSPVMNQGFGEQSSQVPQSPPADGPTPSSPQPSGDLDGKYKKMIGDLHGLTQKAKSEG